MAEPQTSVSLTPVLDGQICFALYNASRAITAHYRGLLAPLGLTYPQYLVMLVLWQTGPLTVTRLGDQLQLDSGTLSPLLRRLQTAGLIDRARRPDDERSVQVSLTAGGAALHARAAHIPERICASTGLGLNEIDTLRRQINELAEHVRASA